MIKRLSATGLNRRSDSFDLYFHEDINIVTGKNGSGKTTLLKLLWYAISGNLERILPEIAFDAFEVVADSFRVSMSIAPEGKSRLVTLRYEVGDKRRIHKRPLDRTGGPAWDRVIEEANQDISNASGSSIFFPTFRRIEGGFSVAPIRDEQVARFVGGRGRYRVQEVYLSSERGNLEFAMNQLAERMSVGAHRFVSSISTQDIVRLLTSKYAEVSERTNRLHMDLSKFILDRVQGSPAGQSPERLDQSREALDEIQHRARNVTQESQSLLRPFTVLSELIAQVFQYKGIRLADPVTLGEAREAIASEVLSAGEKQMLSFLCYNAFADKACLFIDEPEISLHVDWQRILFPILLKQSTGNQFIVATHSPFIYSKYADKELMLVPQRGDENADAPNDGEGDHRLPRENEPADAVGRG